MSIGQGEDEAAESAVDGGLSDHSMDRRSLIKKVGIAGAAAWVAPVVIESMVSPASAASLPPGVYALRLSSEQCDPTPVLDPNGATLPPMCTGLIAAWATQDHQITSQSQLEALGLTVNNCFRRYVLQVTSSNPKVTFTAAGSGSAGLHKGQCVTPALTPGEVHWTMDGASDRNGYFIVITVTA
jgi:hypothetical protein